MLCALVSLAAIIVSCSTDSNIQRRIIHRKVTVTRIIHRENNAMNSYEQLLVNAGFVDISTIDTTIKVDIRYATRDNFVGKNLYNNFKKCFLQPDVARKLEAAQRALKQRDRRYSLVIFDALRPCSIQQVMWDSSKLTTEQKRNFLADPSETSLHSYGVAVDCGIVDTKGQNLDMGTCYDFPGELAYPILEESMLKKGLLTQSCVENRKLLRWAMKRAGFICNDYEWWHFSSCSRNTARDLYPKIIDFAQVMPPPVKEQVSHDTGETKTVYKVQVATSRAGLEAARSSLRGIKVSAYVHEGREKYTAGEFNNYLLAFNLKDSIRNIGITDAFVVCFNNGKRMSVHN